MPDGAALWGFVAAALVVLLIPGPGVLYVITRSVSQGRRAGLVSVVALSAGALVHVAAATAGLSAVLLTSATAFGVVKTLGAAYLIYLGIRALVSRPQRADVDRVAPERLTRLFTDGVLVSVLNPKIAVFFLAFLPQFVQPANGPVGSQILFLGLLYVALALCTDGAYALVSSGLRGAIGGRILNGPAPQYASGVVYLGLGVRTALAERS